MRPEQRRISQKKGKKKKDFVKQFASEGKVNGYIGERGSTCNLIPEVCVPKNVPFFVLSS